MNNNNRWLVALFYSLFSCVGLWAFATSAWAAVDRDAEAAPQAIVARDDMTGEYLVRIAHYRDETTHRFYSKTSRLLSRQAEDGSLEELELDFSGGLPEQLVPGRRLRITQGMLRGHQLAVDRFDAMAPVDGEGQQPQRLLLNGLEEAEPQAAQVVYQRETMMLLISIVGRDGRVNYPALREQVAQGTSDAELIRIADNIMWQSDNSIRKFYMDATHGKLRLMPELGSHADGRSDIYTYRLSWSEFENIVNRSRSEFAAIAQIESMALADIQARTGIDNRLYAQRVIVLPESGTANRLMAEAGMSAELPVGWAYLRSNRAYIATWYVDAYAHELGHSLGLNHAGVAFGPANSADAAYGDTSCMMGYGINRLRGFNIPNLIDLSTYFSLSFFGPSSNPAAYVKTIDVDSSADYTTYNLYSVDATEATDDARRQAVERDPNGYFSVRIPRYWQGDARDGDFYYLSYRTHPQLEPEYRQAVNIHYARLYQQSYLVTALRPGSRDDNPNDFIRYGAVSLNRVLGISDPVTVQVLSENPQEQYITVRLWRGRVDAPENAVPQARFEVTASQLTARFDNRSTDADGTIVSSLWDFGDGVQSTHTSPQHTYARAGSYTVSLTVRDNAGATNRVSRTITIQATNQPPVPQFVYSADGLRVRFSDRSTDADGRIVRWRWEFGDGAFSSESSPERKYAQAGRYRVSLTVTDNLGLTRFMQGTVVLNAPPSNAVPTAPSGLTLWVTQPNVVNLRWSDRSNNETAFQVEVANVYEQAGVRRAGSFRVLGRVPANATRANTSVTQAGSYVYRVRALNAVGTSAASNLSPIVNARRPS